MDSNKRHEHGTVRLTPTSVTKNWREAVVNRLCMLRRKVKMVYEFCVVFIC